MPGMLLVGDAGGLINPFTGEGIAYAVESGEIAAELIAEAATRDRPGLAHAYPIELRRRYGKYFTLGRVFARAIGQPAIMRASVFHAFPRQRLMGFALRLMSNLTDGREGDLDDKVMDWLVRMVPER